MILVGVKTNENFAPSFVNAPYHCLYTLPINIAHTHCLIHIANITSSTEQNRTQRLFWH